MSQGTNRDFNPNQQKSCQIRIRGHLDDRWSDWFEGLAIDPREDGCTLLSGPVDDDAALHGILKRIRDLGLPLLSVVCVDSEEVEGRKNACDPIE